MRAQSHTGVWGTHPVSGANEAPGWSQKLHTWWVAHHIARQQTGRTSLHTAWDAQREVCAPLRADAACDMAAVQGHVSTATQVYGLF